MDFAGPFLTVLLVGIVLGIYKTFCQFIFYLIILHLGFHFEQCLVQPRYVIMMFIR